MKVTGTILLFFLFTTGPITAQPDTLNKILKFPLKTIFTYCQDKPDTPYSKAVLVYDKDHRLAIYSSYNDTTEFSRTVYKYNEQGLLTSKDMYSISKDNKLTLYRTRVYKYDQQNKLFYEGFYDSRGNNKKYEYVYGKKNELTVRHGECNYNKWNDSYEYDAGGKTIRQFRNGELAVKYEYFHDLLVKETHCYKGDNTLIVYEYNEAGLLISKKKNGKVTETRAYVDGMLTERRTYDFDIDPCFYPCCGQYLYKYEYHAAGAEL